MRCMLRYEGNKEGHGNLEFVDSMNLNRETILESINIETTLESDLDQLRYDSVTMLYKMLNGKARELSLSREHARVTIEGRKVFIEDLGSIAGTYVNGRKIGSSLRTIHPDWREREYRENMQKFREANKGRKRIKEGAIIELGFEMFPEIHKYKLIIFDE